MIFYEFLNRKNVQMFVILTDLVKILTLDANKKLLWIIYAQLFF